MNRKALILLIPMILAVFLVGGWFLLRNWNTPEESQKTPVAGENPTQEPEDIKPPANVDTSNWKAYRNENSGIELKIPQEWDALVLGTGIDGDMICFGKKGELQSVVGGEGEVNGCAVMIGPDSRKETKTLVDVETKIIPRSHELKNVFTVKNDIEVGSRKSILLSYAVGNMELYVEHRNNLYKIDLRPYEYNSGDPIIASYYRDTYFGILSTIHFLD